MPGKLRRLVCVLLFVPKGILMPVCLPFYMAALWFWTGRDPWALDLDAFFMWPVPVVNAPPRKTPAVGEVDAHTGKRRLL